MGQVKAITPGQGLIQRIAAHFGKGVKGNEYIVRLPRTTTITPATPTEADQPADSVRRTAHALQSHNKVDDHTETIIIKARA